MSLDRRKGRLVRALVLALAIALLAAGCGGGGDSGSGDAESTAPGGGGESGGAARVAKAEEFGAEVSGAEAQGPEAALRGYFDARTNGEWAKACSYASKELNDFYNRLGKGSGCAAFLEKAAERASAAERAAAAEIEVESVRLEGDNGYVIYSDAEGSRQARPVEREGGTWKVGSQLVQLLEKAQKKQ